MLKINGIEGLDVRIAPYVKALRDKGIETYESSAQRSVPCIRAAIIGSI